MAFLYLIAFGAFPSGPSLNPCNSIRTLLGRGVLQLSWVTSWFCIFQGISPLSQEGDAFGFIMSLILMDSCGGWWIYMVAACPFFDDGFSSEGLFPGQWEVRAVVSLGLNKLVDRRDTDDQPKTWDPAVIGTSTETVSSTLFLVVWLSWQRYTQSDRISLPVMDRRRCGFRASLAGEKIFLLHHLGQAASYNCQHNFISGRKSLCLSTLFSSLKRRIMSVGRKQISSTKISDKEECRALQRVNHCAPSLLVSS